jgi:TetR/AcrR family transcriptional repressor of tetCD
MSVNIRRKNLSDETQSALLKSAGVLFAEQGYTRTSIDNIAAKANVTKGAFYHYFKSKEDIFEQCYANQVERISALIGAKKDTDNALHDALVRCKAFLNFAMRERKTLIPLDEAISVLGWSKWKTIDSALTARHICTVLERMKEAKAIKEYPIELLADMIHGQLVNAVMSLSTAANKAETVRFLYEIIENNIRSLVVE